MRAAEDRLRAAPCSGGLLTRLWPCACWSWRTRSALQRGLRAEGFEVDVAHTGPDGLWRAREGAYSAIVLDLLLPGLNGYVVCRELRDGGDRTPVLMLTAKQGEHDEAEGLELGADDFLRKPFSFVVVVARLRARIRR